MRNLEKYIALLDEQVDGLLLTSRYARHYGAEYVIAEGVAIVTKAGCRYFTDSRYIEAAQNGIRGFEVIMVDGSRDYCGLLNKAIAEFGVTALGYEENYLTVGEFQTYESKLSAALVPYNAAIYGLRACKEDYELQRMRRAQEITDAAFTEVCTRICEGMTEKELAAELIYCLLKAGGEGLSFDPIVVSGPNTSLPHGVPGERRLQKGDFITMDFGVMYQGYCSDMTRTVALGYATEEMKTVYGIVLKAQKAGIAATRPGIPGKAVDEAARAVIREAGYGDYFGHGYGHSLGLEIHESPNCNPREERLLEPGMVCSAEPGIYLPGKFGVRIEDCVVLTMDGCEILTKSPKNLIII